MTLTIAAALQQAQQAVHGGDYHSAATTCTQLVNQFPGYGAAYCLLGEAYREQGMTSDAERAYSAAVVRNPRSPAPYLGLGLVAEEQGAMDAALAFCQVAWELAPNQQAAREPLMRIAMRRYGSDGDLQLTRAGLAQLHASSARLRRAVDEYRGALAELPGRVDLQLGLAEALWRLGENDEAFQLAQATLEQHPDAAPALVILIDIERRSGNTQRSSELLSRLRAVDPDGGVAAGMLAANARADRQFLEVPDDAIPAISGDAGPVSVDRSRAEPVPDFDYRPAWAEGPLPDLDHLEPISVAEFGAPPGAMAGMPEEIEPISLADLDGLPSDLQPMTFEEFGGVPVEPAQPDLSALSMHPQAPPLAGVVPPAPVDIAAPIEYPPASLPPAAMVAGAAVAGGDALASLAASLAGDVADALSRAGEQPRGDDVDASRPPDVAPRGYTSMLQSLTDQGHAPFDPRLPGDVTGSESGRAALNAAGADDLGQMAQGWDTIDDEIERAMPDTIPHGYTDELRALDEIGLRPFEVEDGDERIGIAPDAIPAAEQSPREQDLPHLPVSFASELPPDALLPAGAEVDDLLGGLEPFAFEEFDQPSLEGSNPAKQLFGQSAWDAAQGLSAIPSDEDLDALLAMGEDDLDELLQPAVDEHDTVVDMMPELNASMDSDAASILDVEAGLAASDPAAEAQVIEASDLPASITEDQLVWEESDTAGEAPDTGAVDDLSRGAGDVDPRMAGLLGASLAVTRELSAGAALPDDWEGEAGALVWHERAMDDAVIVDGGAPPLDDRARVEPATPAIEPLRPDTDLFERARDVKQGLVSDGIIAGDRELGAAALDAEPVLLEDAVETLRLDADEVAEDSAESDASDADGALTGATRDVRTLRAALEVTPDDDELHWWLAEALRGSGETAEAATEYRWLIRHAPHRHDAVIEALTISAARDEAPEMAHRLLGDLYRRRGDVTSASQHAAMALQIRRRSGRLR
jgi:tetratricopeptide (TPR) repeat protein